MGGSTPQQRASSYRVDLDGLRGIAIALVVIFHVFVGRVSGGVDVFLLLSGYFFLGSQLRYALRPGPNLNPWWPIWRTLRRLVPALAVVIAATAALVFTLTPGLMNTELARQFTASLLYYQNWELLRQEADYAAAGQGTSPLQHLWSMSVQSQFYLAGILLGVALAWVTSRGGLATRTARRAAAVVLATVTVASFLWASRYGLVGTAANYYSTFSRAWELTLGGLLALLPSTVRIPRRWAGWTAGTGLAMIALTGVVIPTSLAFPGPLTLLPLTGAALVILSGNDNPVSAALASRPATWLGETAYSLYLWHWPLLILVSVLGGYDTPPYWAGLAVIAVSLALAHATHQLVEQPLRQHRKRPSAGDAPVDGARQSLRTREGAGRAAGGVVIAGLAAAVLAVQPYWHQRVVESDGPLDPYRYPGAMALRGAEVPDLPPLPDPGIVSSIYPPIGVDGCMVFMTQGADDMPGPECVYGDAAASTTVVLAGGSHVEPLGVPLDILGRQHGFRVVPMVRQECPIVVRYDDVVSDVCAEWSRNALDAIETLDPDLVISTSTRPGGRAGGAELSVDEVPESYREVWAELADYGIPFLGLRDNPWIFTPEGDHMDPNLCLVSGANEEDCSMAAELVYGPADPAALYLDGTGKQWGADTAGWYCPGATCPPSIGNVSVYRDQNHISNAYAATLAPLLWEVIEPIFDDLGTVYSKKPAPLPERG